MFGLFDRDYFELKEDEIQKEKEIDKKYNPNLRKYGKITHCLEFPKAIRHYKSLFPNNYMDIYDLKNIDYIKKQCDNFEKLINNTSITELDIKRYIQENGYYHIPASIFSRYNFGHHEAVLFKEFPLGTSFRADYLLAGRASGGWQFIFVEFENPCGNITVKSGNWGDTIRKGLIQIEDWKTFLESNYSSIHSEFLKYTKKDLPNEFIKYDSTRMHYVVVAGRRKDFDNEVSRRNQRKYEQESGIIILHYDNLLDDARNLINANSY